MAVLLTDRRLSPELADWCAARIPHVGAAGFGPNWSVGVALHGELAAVVTFHDYYPAFGTLQLSIASANPRWANRNAFGRILALAFDQPWGRNGTQIEKVWCAMPSANERVLAFNSAVGFKREAVLRHHFGRGNHAVIASMMKWEYWAKYRRKPALAVAA